MRARCAGGGARRRAHVAFPAISTGVYGYPLEAATRVAVDTVRAFLAEHALPERVIFCCFSAQAEAAYRAALA